MVFREVRYTSADGLTLYARDYRPPGEGRTPVLCLPGLTRNSKDFEALAPLLAEERRVIAPDFRGRGLSQYGDPSSYRPDVEMADTLVLMDHLGIEKAAVIGTSRGGIVSMFMAAKAPARVAGVALNDIGPRIDVAGLLRIQSYLGKRESFSSWDEAVHALKSTNPGFETLSESEWAMFARRVFREREGRPSADYDPRLAEAFPPAADIAAGKVPEIWGLFDFLKPLPTLLLRGSHSDLLSRETTAEMAARHRNLRAVTVENRGHVPFLDEPAALHAVADWLSIVDSNQELQNRPPDSV